MLYHLLTRYLSSETESFPTSRVNHLTRIDWNVLKCLSAGAARTEIFCKIGIIKVVVILKVRIRGESRG